MKGTLLDFLKLATETPVIAEGLVRLAAEHDFEFTDDEIGDAELEHVAGGTGLASDAIQSTLNDRQGTLQAASSVLKKMSSTRDEIIKRM